MIDPDSIRAALAIYIPSIKEHRKTSRRPFVLGLSGLQGSGKSTWAAALSSHLTQEHGYNTRTLSIDDLYRDHDELVALRNRHPENKLLRSRGQPGTHDEGLAQRFFSDLLGETTGDVPRDGTKNFIRWPAYDKSLHGGQGGRVPEDQWENVPLEASTDILIFEGWCLGFQPLTDAEVSGKWHRANEAKQGLGPMDSPEGEFSTMTLADHSLADVLLINKNLRRYCDTFMGAWRFDGFLHLSTEKLANVYHWRMDQERALRRQKPGMSDGEVVEFVKGYMPAYELYLEHLQTGSLFQQDIGISTRKHARVVLDDQRRVTSIAEI
ncbi:related to ATP-binding protein, putative pantothenate kinase [Cephalotrichum gorgonifer]|uniref:Related to ATP-binding protein, putative pantothenate kinase n=1 Tax=Cephalotrichum gorgonifer TaxID=2041049 RepID=A0AAE8N8M3_9PEZI|nr:related to ATP-binding protein, putative pantothenate kinase [Cephalotrichum gorgonifer]